MIRKMELVLKFIKMEISILDSLKIILEMDLDNLNPKIKVLMEYGHKEYKCKKYLNYFNFYKFL